MPTPRATTRFRVITATVVLIAVTVGGCGSQGDDTERATSNPAPDPQELPQSTPAKSPNDEPDFFSSAPTVKAQDIDTPQPQEQASPEAFRYRDAWKSRTLRPISEQRALSEGVRRLDGRHITLYTDLPSAPEINRLPQIFDQAVPQWAEYFHMDPAEVADWKVRAFLIDDRELFAALGLMRNDLPPFLNGYAVEGECWLYEQPTDYYRRHLLLHEGTHAFMYDLLGSCGPPWYMEGMAELLATHTLTDGMLTLRRFPQEREEVPMLGRIKLVQEAYGRGEALTLANVLTLSNTAHLKNEAYAWSWAIAALLDGHPNYQDRFRSLYRHVNDANFNASFTEIFAEDLRDINYQWQLFVATLRHDHDIERTAVDFSPGEPLVGTASVEVQAARGWQNAGVRLEAGRTYRIAAEGRYQVAEEPKIWWSEPDGVTIRYVGGRPLGMLLAAVVPTGEGRPPINPMIAPYGIGLAGTITPAQSGTLFLSINDSPGELDDNAGTLRANVEIASPAK